MGVVTRRHVLRALASLPIVGAALARRFDPMPKAEACWASEPRNRLPYRLEPGQRAHFQFDGRKRSEVCNCPPPDPAETARKILAFQPMTFTDEEIMRPLTEEDRRALDALNHCKTCGGLKYVDDVEPMIRLFHD